MSGLVDLHCHYLPMVDDGVTTVEEGVELLRGLASLGFATVVATPHIRTAMFPNDRAGLEAAYEDFKSATVGLEGLPETGLGAEHYFDDIVWELFREDGALPYPGGHAALLEFPAHGIPIGVERLLFDLRVRGIRPVLAHPERCDALFRSTDPLDPLLEVGALPLLDLMTLTGKYGRRSRKAAERMLGEGVYYAACSDAHTPAHLVGVAEGMARLRRVVGDDVAGELLEGHPGRILEGTVDA